MPTANRYPGVCGCGDRVEAGAGRIDKSDGRWVVTCAKCDALKGDSYQLAKPGTYPESGQASYRIYQRPMVGCVYWPNGMGYTECSAEYEEAVMALRDAQGALDEVGGFGASLKRGDRDPEQAALYRERYETYCRADDKVQGLLADGGHLGERIKLSEPDPMIAMLGGGKITIAPGGEMRVS